MDKQRKEALSAFCKKVKIRFKNIEMLDLAFHHRSITNEKKHIKNNERLEFLGDSVLGIVTAAYLYNNFPNPEGVVSEKSLAPIALEFGIDKLLILGKGEESSGGRTKPAILADCMEAIIGAYYLDSGYKNAEKYVLEFIIPAINKTLTTGTKDYKTQLQELYQKKTKSVPKYELAEKTGPAHDQTFVVYVHLDDKKFGPAKAKSKKEAEQIAAKMALDSIN